jgi:hypothetical protein
MKNQYFLELSHFIELLGDKRLAEEQCIIQEEDISEGFFL